MISGLIIVGEALEKHVNHSAAIMGWGMYVFGVMIASGIFPPQKRFEPSNIPAPLVQTSANTPQSP